MEFRRRPVNSRRLQRRQFVSGGTAAAAALWLGPAGGAKSARRGPESTDVVVVGAGLAGLYAAMLLRDAGLNVLVLEASDRAGGRCLTAQHLDPRIEFGASQIGPMYARVRDAAQRLGLALAPGAHVNAPYSFVLGESLVAARDWPTAPNNPLTGAERAVAPHTLNSFYVERRNPFNALEEWLTPAAARYDISLAAWLEQQGASSAARHLINCTLGRPGLDAVGLLRMLQESTRAKVDFARYSEGQGAESEDIYQRFALASSHVVGGTSRLTDAMASAVSDALRLRQAVTAIELRERSCEVRCASGVRVRARRAVVAVPFSVLRRIAIAPALTGAQAEAVRQMPYGNQSQVWLRVKSPYWEQDGIEASMWTDGPFTLVRQQIEHDGARELVSVLAFNAESSKLDALAERERGAIAIRYLERVRPSMVGRLEFLGYHSWELAPTVRGCSHSHVPGRGSAWAQAMSARAGRLHFAGEHTRRLEVGMEAAMESGERVALEVLEVEA
jgi:monoamine oxidase